MLIRFLLFRAKSYISLPNYSSSQNQWSMYPWSKVLWYLCSQVIPWFYIAHHLVRITMRLKRSTVVFTCRLKRGNKAPFEAQMLLMAILITLPCSKLFVLKLATVAQNDYLKPKLSLYCHFALKRKRWPPPPPPPHLCFVLAMATQNIYFKGKKNLDSRSCVFFR